MNKYCIFPRSLFLFNFFTILIVFSFFATTSFAAPVVADGITITLNGGEASSNTDNTPAILAINGGYVISNGANVFTTGNNANGATATQSGRIDFNGSTITTSGTGSFGIYASQNGVINANGPFIRTTGAGSAGIVADALGVINLGGPGVETNGINSAGVLALTGGVISGSANVTTNNSNSPAFSAAGGQITYTGGSVATNGASSPVFSASSSGVLSASGFYAPTNGANSPAAFASSGGQITITNSSMQTFGAGSFGAFATGNSSLISLSSLSLEAFGNNGAGLVAESGGAITMSNASVNSTGIQSPALSLSNGGIISITSASATARGANSYGLDVNDGAGSATSILNLTNGSVVSETFDAMHVDNAAVTINSSSGTIRGGNDILLSATDATVNINADDNSNLTGAILSTASTVNLALRSGSVWNVTGNSNLSSIINNSNTIIFAPITGDPLDPASYKTVTTNNYSGNGTIQMNTYLDVTGSPSDKLIIDGGTATGPSLLSFTNTGGDGALTLGSGILVIEAINGGTTAADAFFINSPIPVGLFEYQLYRGGSTPAEANNWYLRTFTLIPDPIAPPQEEIDEVIDKIVGPVEPSGEQPPLPMAPPGFRWVPNFRGPVTLHVSLPSAALLINRFMLTDTLHERVGEEEQLKGRRDLAISPYFNGFWVRFLEKMGNFGHRSIFSDGPQFDYRFGAIQPGLDLYHCEENGNQTFAGVYGILGRADSDVENFFGIKVGTNKITAYALGLYWTYFDEKGWYLDAIVDRSLQTISSDAVRTDAFNYHTHGGGFGGSLEGGYSFLLPCHIIIEPELQLVGTQLSLHSAQGLVRNEFSDGDTITGRVGARLKKTWNLQPGLYTAPQLITGWISLDAWHEFDGDATTNFITRRRTIPLDSTISGSWGEFGIGISGQVSRTASLYTTVTRDVSISKSNQFGYSGNLGLRVNL